MSSNGRWTERKREMTAALPVRSCRVGKQQYPTRSEAKHAARLAAKRGWGNLRAYTCRTCGAWHIGHPEVHADR